MNYLSYFLIFNLVLLFIYGIIAYRFRTFRQVKFRFSGFLVVKMLIRFSLVNLFIYLLIQFTSVSSNKTFIKSLEFEAVLVVDQPTNNSKADQDYSIYASQISPDYSSYKLYIYDKVNDRVSLLIPQTSFLSFLTYLKNKDLKIIKTINRKKPGIESVFKNKNVGREETLNASAIFSASSISTFRNTISVYLFANSIKAGAIFLQGPHHVA